MSLNQSQLKHPILALLKINYDENKIIDEVISNEQHFLTAGVAKSMILHPPSELPIIDQYHLDRVFYNIVNSDGTFSHARMIEDGFAVNTWKTINLLEVPGYLVSRYGSNKERIDHIGKWVWRDDISFPYLTSLVKSLPFERVDIVRIMTIRGPGCGPAHHDINYDHEKFFNSDLSLVNINLCPANAGAPMKTLVKGQILDVTDKAFAFDDRVYHGVPYFDSGFRITIKIEGRMPYEKLHEMIDPAADIFMP